MSSTDDSEATAAQSDLVFILLDTFLLGWSGAVNADLSFDQPLFQRIVGQCLVTFASS